MRGRIIEKVYGESEIILVIKFFKNMKSYVTIMKTLFTIWIRVLGQVITYYEITTLHEVMRKRKKRTLTLWTKPQNEGEFIHKCITESIQKNIITIRLRLALHFILFFWNAAHHNTRNTEKNSRTELLPKRNATDIISSI